MLTDRLPFEDDTPTKVVFKHIHDPIPDPRDVAPHRSIPDVLAEVCLKALQKKAEARYQSADEMYEVLREVEERLEAERSTDLITCTSCGTKNPSSQKFCGSCGAPLDQVNQAGVCGYCDSKITTGRFDWVLARIDQPEAYRG